MFEGLHIEMDFKKAIGNWLYDSGWTEALSDAGVAAPRSLSLKPRRLLVREELIRSQHVVYLCCYIKPTNHILRKRK